ncbi:MAG: ribonuclease PH [Verrucomicrobia bacterium 21-51-4]|nr:MAG: ribonuclease PH [Verrucomicrobia bacterium 21-51-4]HQU08722.1 ribonuclease PH [Opitutales bacterium]
MLPFSRPDLRNQDEMRLVKFEVGIAPHAMGSVLVSFGHTRVICAAMIESKVPGWMIKQGVPGGWLTAEYSMLPYSTLDRKSRDITQGRLDGRTVEIQRLIGRSMRAVLDLQKLPGHTLWIDCDVIQADGGTRTAAITGAYVAARMAVDKLLASGKLSANPFRDSVAAVSAGVFRGIPVLDLCYEEDHQAHVDGNFVMTGSGQCVELQSSGEETTFSPEDFQKLLNLAQKGIRELTALQQKALEEAKKLG